MYGNLDVTESQYILSTIQRKLFSMKTAKFTDYLLKEDFDQIMEEEFFSPQEVLDGRSLCDLCLNYPKEIRKKVTQSVDKFSQVKSTLLAEHCNENRELLEFYRHVGCSGDNLMINLDFNLVTTLRYAMDIDNNQTVKLLLQKVFEINSHHYKDIIMLDLPVMLQQKRIGRLFDFFERDYDEYQDILKS